jgi:hypothetical protein
MVIQIDARQTNVLCNFTCYHPFPDLTFSQLLFLAFDWSGAETNSTFVELAGYQDGASSRHKVVCIQAIGPSEGISWNTIS